MKLIGKASKICKAVVKFMLVRNFISYYKDIRETAGFSCYYVATKAVLNYIMIKTFNIPLACTCLR